MTEAVALDGEQRPSQRIARRIRGLMAEERISGRQMAMRIGMDQAAFSRRHRGDVPWQIDEVAMIASALNVPFAELCAIRDSNPEPADSQPPVLQLLTGRRSRASTQPVHRSHLRLIAGRAS